MQHSEYLDSFDGVLDCFAGKKLSQHRYRLVQLADELSVLRPGLEDHFVVVVEALAGGVF